MAVLIAGMELGGGEVGKGYPLTLLARLCSAAGYDAERVNVIAGTVDGESGTAQPMAWERLVELLGTGEVESQPVRGVVVMTPRLMRDYRKLINWDEQLAELRALGYALPYPVEINWMELRINMEAFPPVEKLVVLRRQSRDLTKPEQIIVEAVHLGGEFGPGAKGLAIVPGDSRWPYRIVHTELGTQLDLAVSRCETLDQAVERLVVIEQMSTDLEFDWAGLAGGVGQVNRYDKVRLESMRTVLECVRETVGLG